MKELSQISIVIIAKNEVEQIAACIESAQQVSNDIIVVDSGSTDGTAAIAKQTGARVIVIEWAGFGAARNEGAKAALNDWVFSLDSDERITQELAGSIYDTKLDDAKKIFGFKRVSFLGNKKIKYGEWGRDIVYRIYNRTTTRWDIEPVHENIVSEYLSKEKIKGTILHYTMKDMKEYEEKTIRYANLSAVKYFNKNKKATILKRFLSPLFGFVQHYLFELGFLDGIAGLTIAKKTYYYTWLKYEKLHQLNKKKKQQTNL